ncbi:uncharacterized protein B0H18DRAFT_274691 [Fomitopsis serialis]|uniref:uncharacterized protein n=1 Tax=Fomitopsis serialis TaxID=139415 RepID=UPI0020075C97|nr:uncharacterized protein B0H18DRAFT_274691 [Neoantrodia serialis]KAH9927844.1 hypothetical protein B0H18DRAFT_274691 [Neoantrodia serialis]
MHPLIHAPFCPLAGPLLSAQTRFLTTSLSRPLLPTRTLILVPTRSSADMTFSCACPPTASRPLAHSLPAHSLPAHSWPACSHCLSPAIPTARAVSCLRPILPVPSFARSLPACTLSLSRRSARPHTYPPTSSRSPMLHRLTCLHFLFPMPSLRAFSCPRSHPYVVLRVVDKYIL